MNYSRCTSGVQAIFLAHTEPDTAHDHFYYSFNAFAYLLFPFDHVVGAHSHAAIAASHDARVLDNVRTVTFGSPRAVMHDNCSDYISSQDPIRCFRGEKVPDNASFEHHAFTKYLSLCEIETKKQPIPEDVYRWVLKPGANRFLVTKQEVPGTFSTFSTD